ncbi:MAG: hypothetical protein K8Q89_10315 [Nitrosarchaeum sp.]|nr:hypothetical protein [Nitrosarchaeum sp.]
MQNISSYPLQYILIFSVPSGMPHHGIAARASDYPFFKIIITISAKTSAILVYSALVSLWMLPADVLALVHT